MLALMLARDLVIALRVLIFKLVVQPSVLPRVQPFRVGKGMLLVQLAVHIAMILVEVFVLMVVPVVARRFIIAVTWSGLNAEIESALRRRRRR